MIREHCLWSNGPGAPLMVLIPGGTGAIKDATSLGYPASAGFFWLRGYSCYIASTAGQDGNPGAFSIARCLGECRTTLKELQDRLTPRRTCIFGSCSGGTVATHLAGKGGADMLFLWETLPRYSLDARQEFIRRAPQCRVTLSEGFLAENLDTAEVAESVLCPVHCLYGDAQEHAMFVERDADELAQAFSGASSFVRWRLSGADHSVTRGSNKASLLLLLQYVTEHADASIHRTDENHIQTGRRSV